jgi:hypothetical protein
MHFNRWHGPPPPLADESLTYFNYHTGKDIGYDVKMARVEADMRILKLQVNFHFAYIRPKVVGPFPGPCASRSYVHRAALLCCIFYFAHQMPVFELQNEHTMLVFICVCAFLLCVVRSPESIQGSIW